MSFLIRWDLMLFFFFYIILVQSLYKKAYDPPIFFLSGSAIEELYHKYLLQKTAK